MTIKGPAIFLAQFAGDKEPFNTLESITKWAADLGYKGVQIPSWDSRMIDLKKASEFLLNIEDEDILTAGFIKLLEEYWSEKGFLGTSWFVLRFTFSGKIFKIKW